MAMKLNQVKSSLIMRFSMQSLAASLQRYNLAVSVVLCVDMQILYIAHSLPETLNLQLKSY